MKMHSDNIKAIPGIPIILNLNYFPDKDHTIEAFKEILLKSMSKSSNIAEPGSVVGLTTPFVSMVGDGTYKLERPNLWWSDLWIKRGHIFKFGSDGRLILEEGAGTWEKVAILPAQFRRLIYDFYYKGRDEEVVTDPVATELDIPKEFLKIAGMMKSESIYDDENEEEIYEEVDEEDVTSNMVKMESIYVPNLTPDIQGRVFVYQPVTEDGDDYFDDLNRNEEYYDQYLVEFVDKSQPFAYLTIEMFNTVSQKARENGEKEGGWKCESLDPNAELWQDENSLGADEFAELYAEQVKAVSSLGASKDETPLFTESGNEDDEGLYPPDDDEDDEDEEDDEEDFIEEDDDED